VSAAAERVESAQPQFMTVAEVASLLRVHEKTIVRLALRDASMPCVRLGRVVRFEREALMRWLARRGSPKNHRSGP
jgi:excisionase family DNA binding protein